MPLIIYGLSTINEVKILKTNTFVNISSLADSTVLLNVYARKLTVVIIPYSYSIFLTRSCLIERDRYFVYYLRIRMVHFPTHDFIVDVI